MMEKIIVFFFSYSLTRRGRILEKKEQDKLHFIVFQLNGKIKNDYVIFCVPICVSQCGVGYLNNRFNERERKAKPE